MATVVGECTHEYVYLDPQNILTPLPSPLALNLTPSPNPITLGLVPSPDPRP